MSTVWLLSLVVLMSAWHRDTTGKVIQTYHFENPQGYESSFLIDGGKVTVTCTDTNNGSVTLVRRRNENIVEKIENSSPFDYDIPLNATLLKLNEDYKCFGASKGELAVKAVYCDPFQMIPPVLNCGANETCKIYNASRAKCEKKLSSDCFLREFTNVNPQNIAKPSVVCTTTDALLSGENGKTKYGLCHARAGSDKPFEGLTENVADCLDLKALVFNGMTVKQDKLLFTTKNPSAWSITYNDQSYYKRCIAYDSDNNKFAKYETNKSNKLEKITSNIPTKLPSKLRLECKISGHLINQPDTWTISTFVIIYDKTKSLYSAEIKLDNSTKKQALDLTCECKTPPGFFCSLSWEKPKKVKGTIEYSESDTSIRKTIFKDDHDKTTEYSCYMRTWVSNYPVNFLLINVPDIDVISVTKSVTKADFKNLAPKPVGNDTGDGVGGVNNDKDSNKNDQSDKADQSSSNTLVYVITAIIAIAILVAVIVGILFIVRKRNNRKREEEDKIVEEKKEKSQLKHQEHLAKVLLKEKQQKKKAKEEKMARVMLLKKDKNHQRTADDFLTLQRSKGPISKLAKQLDPKNKHPNFDGALQKHPEFSFVRDEWNDIEEAKCLRRLSEPPVCGYLIGCRFPAMICCIKSFVAQDRVSLLQKEPPTPEQQREQRLADPPKPSALNANFVHDLHGRKFFILCQAPRLVDMELFLDMIISQEIKLVINLISDKDLPDTNLGMQKFYPYNNLKEGESKTFGRYTFTSVLNVPNVCFKTSSFRITTTDNKSSADVKQKQLPYEITVVSYTAWGDHSSPEDCRHILSLRKSIDNIMDTPRTGNDAITSQAALTTKTGASIAAQVSAPTVDNRKVVVHCAAGLGRSGALATAYILLQYLELYGCPVNIKGIAELVRLDRENTIQDVEQYLLLYWIAADYQRSKLAALGPQRQPKSQLASVAKERQSTNSKSDA